MLLSSSRWKKINLIIIVSSVLFYLQSRADIDGKVQISNYNCETNVYSSLDKICQVINSSLGVSVCNKTANTCVKGNEEIFSGLNIELASPTNIKNWTGYGGMGELYQAAAVCMMRDLKDGNVTSEAKASTFLGDVTVKQNIGFVSFNKDTRTMEGYHSAKLCGPVVGCLDAFTQKFKLQSMNSPLKGSGQKVGDYAIFNSFSLDVETDGVSQGLKVTLPALDVYTPYGKVSAKPEFDFGKSFGFILAPYNGNYKSGLAVPDGTAKMIDLYGRNPGVAYSQKAPYRVVLSDKIDDNSLIGWISQIALGGRDPDLKTSIWSPAATQEYPIRPDFDGTIARSKEEKFPNVYMGADVKVSYSPTDLLPDWIRNSGFITLSFGVYAQPTLNVGASSQMNLYNNEVSRLKPPYNNYSPMNFDQYHGFAFQSAVSAAVRFALEAGVDLNIHLHVPLLFTSIDEDLVDIHPKTTVAEKIDHGYGKGVKSASAVSQASQVLATKNFFQIYNTLNGPKEGVGHIKECLAKPTPDGTMPPDPTYTPGNPVDLTKGILYPCDICVGMNDKTWVDDKGATQTLKGFIKVYFPSNENTRPTNVKWNCDQVVESGCYNMCKYDPSSNKLVVVETALEMIAKGEAKKMPLRCR